MYSGAEIYGILKGLNFDDKIASYITAQAGHETGGFNSAIFKSNNNAFGMKYAGQAMSIGEKNGYANYASLKDSVTDLVRWYVKNRNSILSFPLYINSLDSYVKFLKNRDYFEDSEENYLAGCKYFYNQLFS